MRHSSRLTSDDLSNTNLGDEITTVHGGIESADALVRAPAATARTARQEPETYTSPLLSGFAVSFKNPVYLMVTWSPLTGMAPWPSWRRVLVTPMIAEVARKLRVN